MGALAATLALGAGPAGGSRQLVGPALMHEQQLPPALTSSSGADGVDNRQLVVLDGEAKCLDGSPYKFYVWPGNSSDWSVFINGGGWCACCPFLSDSRPAADCAVLFPAAGV